MEEYYFRAFSGVVKGSLELMPMGRTLVESLGGPEDLWKRASYRLGRYAEGLKVIKILRDYLNFNLEGKAILDLACGFGGHAAAFCTTRTFCIGADFINHGYNDLQRALNAGPSQSMLRFVIADMNSLPFKARTFDLIFSNDGAEHVPNLSGFLRGLGECLKENGILLIRVPVALKEVRKDSHYALPFVSLLPARLKPFVAEKIFHRGYPWKLHQTFNIFSRIKFLCSKHNMNAIPLILKETRKYKLVERLPFKRIWIRLLEEIYWDWIIIRKGIPN